MKWEKLGLVFKPTGQNKTLYAYGSMPMALQINNNLFRFYFSSRDSKNSSSINFIEVNIKNPNKILKISKKPVLSMGPLGHFDDNGVYSGCLFRFMGDLFMFYSGRSNGEGNLFYMNIGLAVSKDNGLSFKRVKNYPILSRSEYDPWLVTAPSVFEKNNQFYMVYTSGIAIFKDRTSNYDLKLARSDDFFNWRSTGKIVIPLNDGESNISTPSIIYLNNKFHLWFSVKPNDGQYRIGYASSSNGMNWKRDDKLMGLNIGGASFDEYSVCYPNIFIYENYIYMLYSGSFNGKDGFGITRSSVKNLM